MKEKMYGCFFIVLLAVAIGVSSSVFAAEDPSGFVFNAKRSSINSMLSNNMDKSVTVILESGARLSGRIADIKGELLYISDERMKGRTNNHVLIRINRIEALIFDASEFG